MTQTIVINTYEISGLRQPLYNSGAANKMYVDTISSNSISKFADSSNIRFRFQASSLARQSYLHSSNQAIHSFNVANYITSTSAISRFYPSTLGHYYTDSGTKLYSAYQSAQRVFDRFDHTLYKPSSGNWKFISSQRISGGIITSPSIPLTYSVANTLISANHAWDIAKFRTPTGKSVHILQGYASNSGCASIGNLYVQMLSGNTIKYKCSSNILQQYSNPSSANGYIILRFCYSGTTLLTGVQYGSCTVQVGIW